MHAPSLPLQAALNDAAKTRDSKRYRSEQVRACWLLGFSFTPLNGKVPATGTWQAHPRETILQALRWARRGNVGLRTGRPITINGVNWLLVVIDVDPRHHGDVSALNLPPTVTVVTGSGGRHYYFLVPVDAAVRNSTGTKLGPGVDIKSLGGQVVFPGSIHPESGVMYGWADGLSPSEIPIAVLPELVLLRLQAVTSWLQPKEPNTSATGVSRGYVNAAVRAEVDRVISASTGTRNDALNRAAFALGQLVGARVLDRRRAFDELFAAASVHFKSGFTDQETGKTINSGLDGGARQPRDLTRRRQSGARSERT